MNDSIGRFKGNVFWVSISTKTGCTSSELAQNSWILREVYIVYIINVKTSLFDRIGQSVAALLRRLGLPYQGNESHGKIKISGLAMKRWFQPKLASFTGKPGEFGSSQLWLGKGITHQQRDIRTGNLSLE